MSITLWFVPLETYWPLVFMLVGKWLPLHCNIVYSLGGQEGKVNKKTPTTKTQTTPNPLFQFVSVACHPVPVIQEKSLARSSLHPSARQRQTSETHPLTDQTQFSQLLPSSWWPLHWTCSGMAMSVLYWGAHTCSPYSRCGFGSVRLRGKIAFLVLLLQGHTADLGSACSPRPSSGQGGNSKQSWFLTLRNQSVLFHGVIPAKVQVVFFAFAGSLRFPSAHSYSLRSLWIAALPFRISTALPRGSSPTDLLSMHSVPLGH